MRRFFVKKENIFDDYIVVCDKDFFHLANVLRLKFGDEIVCFCGDGYDYVCKIIEMKKNFAKCELLKKVLSDKTPSAKVTLFQGVTKGEKLELIIQKVTELGISEVFFFKSEFTSRKMLECKIDKLKINSIEASKQCGRSDTMQINGILSFQNLVEKLKNFDCVIFAYEKQSSVDFPNIYGKVAIVIGSEGGFSENEAEKLSSLNNVYCISMGKRILRSETASIVLSGIVMEKMGEWK